MPFGIPAEDFHGGFGLPDLSEESNALTKAIYRRALVNAKSFDEAGKCARCGYRATDVTFDYCPRCGDRLDWE